MTNKEEEAEDQGGFVGLKKIRILTAADNSEDLVIENEKGEKSLGFYEEQALSSNILNLSSLASLEPAEWEEGLEDCLRGGA